MAGLRRRVADRSIYIAQGGGVSAATFYVDPAGSDAANGLSTGTAWQTVSKINSNTFNPGDQILFKRGGTWRGTTLTPPSAGASGSPVTFGAYGTGAYPILSGGSVVTSWSVFGGSTYQATLGTAPTYVVAGTQALTLGSGSGTLTANQWFWAASVLYVNLGGTNPTSVTVEAAITDTVLWITTKNYVTIDSLDIRFGADRAVRWSDSDYCILTGCNFQWCSTRGNGGTIAMGNDNNARITACTWDQLLNDGVWAHDCANLEIDNGTMTNIGHLVGDAASDGIQIDDESFGTGLDSTGLWIHDMTITMHPNSPKGCIIVGSDPAKGSISAIIERNTLNGGNFGVAAFAPNLTIRDNEMLNQVTTYGGGVHVSDGSFAITGLVVTRNLIAGSNLFGIVLQDGTSNRQVTIVNNTIVDCGRVQMYLGSPVYGTIENNILWNTGTAPSLRTLYILSVAAAQTLVVDYNLLQSAFANYLRFGASEYSTLAAWRSATGYDAHSISSDPLFNNAGAGDYTLSAPSPARDAGIVVTGIGQTVIGSAPDIGYAEAAAIVVILRQLALSGVGA